MIYKADLHTHSTASDGQHPPAELARLAAKRGMDVWALTDHDNLDGLDEAAETAQSLGLQFIHGVELSADDYLNLHILGYDFSVSTMRPWIDGKKKGRDDRKYRIWRFLKGKGVDVPLEEVDAEAAGGAVGRPHFARVMLRHGVASTWKEVFDLYLDTPEFQEIEKGTKPSAQECIERIKDAGGKASLAHPYQIVLHGESLEELVRRLAGYGLDAVECCYPIHTPEQTAEYLRIAKTYGLHVSGGSDFHGESKPDHPLAAWELDLDWLL